MAGKLSFSIAINLLTENFKRGTSNVKNGLRAMQMQVLTFAAALGAGGLGLSGFVSQLIAVSRETSRVTTSLKNVSGGMGQFADNQRFLIDMAKKYGLEINALTGNFAKFTAASQVSGMSMMDQRKIFEAVSRACTAFGMSADDSNGVFLALSQMMSKGKISSEELRLQMGERLPVALQAMAKAAGVSVGGLDKLMKQGKLMSKDVLPKFADALNEMIPNVDTDNLETSVNHLKNAFTEFTKGTNIQSAYKGVIDWLTGAVKTAGENIKKIVSSVAAFVTGVALGRMFKWIIVQLAISQRAAMVAASRSAKAAGVAFDEVAWKANSAGATIRTMFTRLGNSMKAAFVSALPTAILVFLSSVAAKLISMRQETKRIRSLFSDYKAESNQIGQTAEIVALNTQLKLMNEKGASQDQINGAQAKLQKMLGDEHASQEELNKLVAERVELLKAGAEVDFYTRKKLDTEDQISALQRKKGNAAVSAVPTGGVNNMWSGPMGVKTLWNVFNPFDGAVGETNSIDSELIELNRILSDANNKLENATAGANALGLSGGGSGSGSDDKKSTLQKAEDKYAQSIRELEARREVEKMSLSDYNKALDELNCNALIEAKASNDKKILDSDYMKMLQNALVNPRYSKSQAELEKVEKEYKVSVALAKKKLDKGLLSQQGYNDAISEAAVSAANSAVAIDNIGKTADGFINKMLYEAESNMTPAKMKQRDTTFDYKKSKVDISGEVLDNAKGYAKQLQEQAKKAGKDLSDELAAAIANVPSLEEALKVAVVMEDVKKLREELSDGVYSGMKDVASSADRLVSSFQNLSEVFDPESEANGWERLMAVWSAMTNAVDAFLSIAKTIETLTEVTNKLAQAKDAEAGIDTAVTAVKVANAGTETAAEVTALGTQTTAEVAASTLKSTAASTEMAAKSTAAYAAIPFVGVGLAAAQILAMQSLIAAAAIPKFATGGIFMGGTSSGDKGLARLNKGEMILNGGQQSRLFEAINSGRLGDGQNINIGFDRVRGSDLLLAINNTLKRQGKKPL